MSYMHCSRGVRAVRSGAPRLEEGRRDESHKQLVEAQRTRDPSYEIVSVFLSLSLRHSHMTPALGTGLLFHNVLNSTPS